MKKTVIFLLIWLIPTIVFSEITGKITELYVSKNPYADFIIPKKIIYYYNEEQIAKELLDEEGNINKTIGKIPDGVVKIYTKDGILFAKNNYKNNRLGIQRRYYDSGKLEGEYNYRNGKLEGMCKTYYERGNLSSECNYIKGKKEGVEKLYSFLTGKEGILWMEENYEDNKKVSYKVYYKSGAIKEEGFYTEDKKEGIAFEYYEEGQLKAIKNYENNKLKNIKEYDNNEMLSAEREYKDDKLEGMTKLYYKNEKLMLEENYKNDKKEGISREYYENGEIKSMATYKKGNKINSKKYDELGKLVLDQDYPEESAITDEGITQGLSDTLRTSFFKTGKFMVLERTKMKEILKEQAFQLTGCTTTQCAVEIGKILNVNYMVIGSVAKIGKEYVINIRIVSVKSSEVIIAEVGQCSTEKELINTIEKIVVNIADKLTTIVSDSSKRTIAIIDIEVK